MRHTALLVTLIACAPGEGELDSGPEQRAAATAEGQRLRREEQGRRLFHEETFDGNGRTCATCHLPGSGAIGPEDVQAAFEEDPSGPLFRSIDSDDGMGESYSQLLDNATFRVVLDLPENVRLVDDPSARQVVLRRGASSMLNATVFEDVFMQDGRNLSLESQAAGAIAAHYEPGRSASTAELRAIADYQRQSPDFTSSGALQAAQRRGLPPELPPARTEEEARGRVWFEARPEGVCAHCHGGPFLNEVNEFILVPLPPGARFFTAFVSEFNAAGLPVQTFEFSDPDDLSAPPVLVSSPDPGRALITGDPADANLFRIPTLWGARHTAPYLHDNSAADLEELMDHYAAYFAIVGVPFTEQDKRDIIAYMQLLE